MNGNANKLIWDALEFPPIPSRTIFLLTEPWSACININLKFPFSPSIEAPYLHVWLTQSWAPGLSLLWPSCCVYSFRAKYWSYPLGLDMCPLPIWQFHRGRSWDSFFLLVVFVLPWGWFSFSRYWLGLGKRLITAFSSGTFWRWEKTIMGCFPPYLHSSYP